MIAQWRNGWRQWGTAAIMPVLTLAVLLFMVVPVAPVMLDIGFVTNIVISLAVLMVAVQARHALEFSSFPTILLFATLLRLSLNVASTRVVLLHGHEGGAAAGHIIEAFGAFLIGGDYAVGLFVFAIVMIINLIVITKGASRVSEVAARFTLDALPGKQMAIDADLNAGLLTPDEAKTRRQTVAVEAEFYGAMDGASKFVKGDAVAGVLILVINILGGIALGMMSHGLTLGDAAQTYVMLAVGDALVAQVPALLLSVATAAIVTRVGNDRAIANQLASQFAVKGAWAPVAAIMALLGLLPGMPHAMLLSAAAGAAAIAYYLHRQPTSAPASNDVAIMPDGAPVDIQWNDVIARDKVVLSIGMALVPMVDPGTEARGPLLARLTGVRNQLSRDLGFVVPPIKVRDDMALPPTRYQLSLGGVMVADGEVFPRDLLALDSGDCDPISGARLVKDPSFGLDAYWISPDRKAEAVMAGYTVVDAATVIATHINQMVVHHAADLFGMEQMADLIEVLRDQSPQIAQALTPDPYPLSRVAALASGLLREGVSLREFGRIAEAMIAAADAGLTGQAALLAYVRQAMGGVIVNALVPQAMPLPVITLAADLESLVAEAVRLGGDGAHPIEPALGQRIVEAVQQAATQAMANAITDGLATARFALVTGAATRATLAALLRPHVPDVPVLSVLEIPETKAVNIIAIVGAPVALDDGNDVHDAAPPPHTPDQMEYHA